MTTIYVVVGVSNSNEFEWPVVAYDSATKANAHASLATAYVRSYEGEYANPYDPHVLDAEDAFYTVTPIPMLDEVPSGDTE